MSTFTVGNETVHEARDGLYVTWTWTSNYDDLGLPSVEHRISWLPGGPEMYYGVKNPAQRWVETVMRNQHFRASTIKQARELVREFVGS